MTTHDAQPDPLAGPHDLLRGPTFERRRNDWRLGAVTYHAMVDRFAPSLDLKAKKHLYPEPKRLMSWDERPERGTYLEEHRIWSHELEFWGGDLASLRTGLDHIQRFGVTALYLNPIHGAYSNHKYDADDWATVSPEFGTREDVVALARELEGRGMKLILDGVFNHMGRRSERFQAALNDEEAPERDWFDFDERYKDGYRAWFDSANLPEVNLESQEVRDQVWATPESVVRSYLRDGVAGWRLDVAYDYGPAILHELTRAAHDERADSVVIGEIWNYPEEWFPSVDGVMNFHVRELMLHYLRAELPGAGPAMGRALERMVRDAQSFERGYEHLLMTWLILDNHDTGRLATVIPDPRKRAIAQIMQFTLPGAPVIYYGVESGMTGGGDPEMRGPMRWDKAREGMPEFDRLMQISAVRERCEALRIGDFRLLDAHTCLAYQRRTDRWRETVTVVINAGDRPAKEVVSLRDSKVMAHAPLRCELTGAEIRIESGVAMFEIPAWTAWVLRPVDREGVGYSSYKRVL